MVTKQELVEIAKKDLFPPRALQQLYLASGLIPEHHINPITNICFADIIYINLK